MISEREQDLLNHVSRWGEDGYPIFGTIDMIGKAIGGNKPVVFWRWEWRGIVSSTSLDRREIERDLEKYLEEIRDRKAGRSGEGEGDREAEAEGEEISAPCPWCGLTLEESTHEGCKRIAQAELGEFRDA